MKKNTFAKMQSHPKTPVKMTPQHRPKPNDLTKTKDLNKLDTPAEFSGSHRPISTPPPPSHLPDEEEPKALYIGQGSEFWKPLSPTHTIVWSPPVHLPNMEATPIVYISQLPDPGAEISIFRHPKLTEEIHFDGSISQHNFNALLSHLTNLKILEVHISTLEDFNFPRKIGFPNFLNLPKLESLQISSYNFGKSHAPTFKMDKIVMNICSLLTKTFPSLSYLSLSLPLIRDKDRELSQAVLKCARTHYRTLKSLNIELTFDAKVQEPETNSKGTFTATPISEQELDFTDSRGIQLHSFHYFSSYKTETTGLWRHFLQTQGKLEYLQFWCGEKYFALLTPVILQNGGHLHTIALNINPLLGTKAGVKKSHIDCIVFSKCYPLKTLVLKGKPIFDTDPSSMTSRTLAEVKKSPDITNCHYLPKGLQLLRLIHMKMHKNDASHIAREFPQLTKLYLEDIGFEDEFGMTLGDVAHLLDKPEKTLVRLDIHQGLNKSSFKDVRKNDGGFAVLAKLLFKLNNPDSFQVTLREDGEWDTTEDEFVEEDDILVEKEVFHENFKGMVTEDDLMNAENDDIRYSSQTGKGTSAGKEVWTGKGQGSINNNLNRSGPPQNNQRAKNVKTGTFQAAESRPRDLPRINE